MQITALETEINETLSNFLTTYKPLTAGKSREGANTPWQTSYLCTPQGNASGVSAWDYLFRHLKHAQTYIPWALLGCFPCSHTCLGKSIWDKPCWLSQISIWFFYLQIPIKAAWSHPCWVLPHTRQKNQKICTEYSNRLRKKKTQTFYLDLIQANTHWFQGDSNWFRTKLKSQWKSLCLVIYLFQLLSFPLFNF